MRLLSCHIVNFGTLSDYSQDFLPGRNEIFRENGWGKSSLAAFLRAMLYGLPTTRRQSLDENDRKRYAPWNGGVFGGTLDIDVGGKAYRIERTFSAAGTRDRFRLFELEGNLPSQAYSEHIGEEILGIDADGFSKTLFFGQNDRRETVDDPSVRARLGALLDRADDAGGYDGALAALEKERRALRTQQGGGRLPQLAGQVEAAERALAEAEQAALDAQSAQEALRAADAEIEKTEEALAALQRAGEERERERARSAVLAHGKTLCGAYRDCLQEQRGAETLLGETASCSRAAFDEITAEAETLLAQNKTAQREYTEAQKTYSALGTRYTALETLYSDRRAPDAQTLRAAGLPETVGDALRGRIRFPQEAEDAKEHKGGEKRNTGGRILPILRIFGIGTAVCGILLLLLFLTVGREYTALLPFGAAALLLALAAVLFSILLKEKTENSTDTAKSDRADEDRRLAEEMLASAYRDCTAARAEAKERMSAAEKTKRETDEALRALFSRFGAAVRGRYENGEAQGEAVLRAAIRARDVYDAAKEKQTAAEEALERFCREHGMNVRTLLAEADSINTENAGSAQVSHTGGIPDDAGGNAEEALREKLSGLRRERDVFAGRAARCTGIGSHAEEYKRTLAAVREKYAEAGHRYEILLRTEQYLADAKNALSSRYLDRMERYFRENYAVCTGSEDVLTLDAEFTVRAEIGGIRRETASFSCGYRDLVRFCMRLALADTLFPEEGEGAVLILDDPFVNLDEVRACAANRLLDEKAKRFQILYLTCHKENR